MSSLKDSSYKPNYTITNEINTLIADIDALVDALAIRIVTEHGPKQQQLNRLRSIHSSIRY
jgi:hypothetical protein